MHLTCFGNIVLIAFLVLVALFVLGLGGAIGSRFENKIVVENSVSKEV